MTRGTYSGHDIIKALGNWGFHKVDQTGSHVKLKYVHPDTGKTRYVTVPLHDELAPGTLRSIADQAGAEDSQAFLDEMDKMV
ncbi:type II toxin-antitoxin system HicA family toxin [Natrarchaeobius oligotrophus]|uniref:Type II toxin-antitoxin system HicA family toxin n=1 Tax=Natrarchaeobius chitinivorans TaxID=1679083 RepID=A0A3N6MAX3_NATCH|nr:type II toxin-antitoxin system HicA family toxin [Natrarchaeobius chitinivorans]RQH00939.1 type II toxin-antitoxin system HicA family toxin [Natrarchaeobius chitinivorans]